MLIRIFLQGVKIGPAMLYGASGATRKGTLKGGKWHGEATYTTQVNDHMINSSYSVNYVAFFQDGEIKKELWDNGQRV